MTETRERWTGEMVGRMHIHRVSQEELGAELGIKKSYVCCILNGRRKPPGIEERMKEALEEIIRRREGKEDGERTSNVQEKS